MLGKVVEITKSAEVEVSIRHILRQIEDGQTLAAADHILIRASQDQLPILLKELLDKVAEFIAGHPSAEENVFTTLIRMGLNLVGRDTYVAHFPREVVQDALVILKTKTKSFEASHEKSANAAVQKFLSGMSSVNGGDSLPAYMAEQIKRELAGDFRPSRFIDAFGEVARNTIYWKMVDQAYCKFGNDYARGLEILRHLGFSQVSTNPVLAAKAFDEDPSLVELFEEEIEKNSSWKHDAKAHGHEMVMAGTLLALWPNLEVFRPLALLANNLDYMISFQLNPNVADDATLSLEDARRAYTLAQEHLRAYDQCLGVKEPGKLRPNIVFKVAGSSRASREVTRELNASGIGTNNTVTYTASQEILLMIEAFEGKATAVKSGKPVTRTYETNMGGRFVSHLREEEAKRVILQVAALKGEEHAKQVIMELAKKLHISDQDVARAKAASHLADTVDIVCAFKNMKSLTNEGFLEATADAGLSHEQVQRLETDLRKAGTLVARRVYQAFYEKRNHEKWIEWLQRRHNLGREEATLVLDSMDVLPASKRVPEDTYDTLVSPNMCNTEFPNHAKAVQIFSEKEEFDLAAYKQAALQPEDLALIGRLNGIRDFVRGYESVTEASTQLVQVGVLSKAEDLGLGGVKEEEWPEFGPVRKTMSEFKEAYEKFMDRCIKLAEKHSRQ